LTIVDRSFPFSLGSVCWCVILLCQLVLDRVHREPPARRLCEVRRPVPVTLDGWPDRCGLGQRLPMLVISPWTRQNYVSGNLTNTVSITKFIEDNWLRGQRIGGGSYDAISGSLYARGGLLNFRTRPNFRPVILDPTTGEVVSG